MYVGNDYLIWYQELHISMQQKILKYIYSVTYLSKVTLSKSNVRLTASSHC